MPKYRVTTGCVISLSTVVEARSRAAARKIAFDRNICDLGSTGAEDETVEWVHSGEIDGEPIDDVDVSVELQR